MQKFAKLDLIIPHHIISHHITSNETFSKILAEGLTFHENLRVF